MHDLQGTHISTFRSLQQQSAPSKVILPQQTLFSFQQRKQTKSDDQILEQPRKRNCCFFFEKYQQNLNLLVQKQNEQLVLRVTKIAAMINMKATPRTKFLSFCFPQTQKEFLREMFLQTRCYSVQDERLVEKWVPWCCPCDNSQVSLTPNFPPRKQHKNFHNLKLWIGSNLTLRNKSKCFSNSLKVCWSRKMLH